MIAKKVAASIANFIFSNLESLIARSGEESLSDNTIVLLSEVVYLIVILSLILIIVFMTTFAAYLVFFLS